MNLIEQLGGYEKAKEALIAEQRSKNIDPVIYINGDEVLIDAIDDALLDYRRQHNIFEVGDKVVIKAHPFWPEDYMIHDVKKDHIGKWYMSAWRHATDAEIEAGKRLEVDSE